MKNSRAQMFRSLPWFIAIIAVIVAIATTFFWMSAETEIKKGNISTQKDQVREFCLNQETASQAECKRELDQLSNMLIDLQKDMKQAKKNAGNTPQATYTITPEAVPVPQTGQ